MWIVDDCPQKLGITWDVFSFSNLDSWRIDGWFMDDSWIGWIDGLQYLCLCRNWEWFSDLWMIGWFTAGWWPMNKWVIYQPWLEVSLTFGLAQNHRFSRYKNNFNEFGAFHGSKPPWVGDLRVIEGWFMAESWMIEPQWMDQLDDTTVIGWLDESSSTLTGFHILGIIIPFD